VRVGVVHRAAFDVGHATLRVERDRPAGVKPLALTRARSPL
jgi:hypothetical protein